MPLVANKRLWRGRDLARLNAVTKWIKSLQARDKAMTDNATSIFDVLFYFVEDGDDALAAAMQLILDRCDACKRARH